MIHRGNNTGLIEHEIFSKNHMQKSYFEKAVEIIDNNPQLAHFAGPKSDEVIKKKEEALGVQFPESYRKFLKRYGGGGFGAYDFYGINKIGDDGFLSTFLARKVSKWPDHFIDIYGVGEGTEFVIDTSQRNEKGECPIVAVPIQYEQENKLELIANSFEEFFYDTVKKALDNHTNPPLLSE